MKPQGSSRALESWDPTHLAFPALHQGPHEDDVAQGAEVPAVGQGAVCFAAWLCFSSKTGFIHQEVCDLGEHRGDAGGPFWLPSGFQHHRIAPSTLMVLNSGSQHQNHALLH